MKWLWTLLLAFSAFAFEDQAVGGHSLRLVTNGADAFNERIKLIYSAKRSILLSTFIYDTDETSTKITQALCTMARRRRDVRIIVDWVGAKKFYERDANRLRKCGAGVLLFEPSKWDLLKLHKTMHEKLLIIDGETVYMGGRGIQNSYHDQEPAHKFFHDMDAVIEGPAACWWHGRFIEHYQKVRLASEPCRDFDCRPRSTEYEQFLYGKAEYAKCKEVTRGSSRVLPVYSNPIFKNDRPLEDQYLKLIDGLEEGGTLKLYSPYFVPTPGFRKALIRAKKDKGINVQVITNSIESSDEGVSILVAMAAVIGDLMEAGIDIRIFPGPEALHRKVAVYSSRIAHIGSDNLDYRGQHEQTESAIFTDDAEIVRQLEEEFDQDLGRSAPLTYDYLKKIESKASFFEKMFIPVFKEFF